MIKLLAIGLSLVAAHAPAHHHHAYWWLGAENCTIQTGTTRQGVLRGIPYITCTPDPAGGWHATPQPLNPTDNVNPTPGAENYCPLRPGGWCVPPAGGN